MPFPPSFTNNWDTTFPPDTELANLLGANLRQVRVDVMQRMSLLSGTLANRPTPETVNATWGGTGFGLIFIATDTQQVFQWNGATWNQINVGGASLVATVSLTAQAAAIGSTLLYAVPSSGAGIYRAAFDLITTQVGTAGQAQGNIAWVNGPSSNTAGTSLLSVTTPGNEVGFVIPPQGLGGSPFGMALCFFAAGSTNINYSVTFTGVTGAFQYSFRARLEFLG